MVKYCYLKEDNWKFEKKAYLSGFSRVAGVDEAGRGPLAGPVVSAAVILPKRVDLFGKVDDSKKLSKSKLELLYRMIYDYAIAIAIGVVDSFEIDRVNILNASLTAMRIAVQNLVPGPDHLLIDGIFEVPINISQETIVKGDSASVSIGAASIIAKVTRDRIMSQADLLFPEFGFDRNKGYPTKSHRESLHKFGYCFLHRKTFKGVR